MRRFTLFLWLLFALPLAAERRLDLIVDVEGVHRQNDFQGQPGDITYNPEFDNGGGIGVGLNWELSSRTSLEFKAAVLASQMQVTITGEDFVGVADIGYVTMVPLSAVIQWHPVEHGSLQPYIGAGVVHVFLEDIEQTLTQPRTEFTNTTGLVLDAGLRIPFSKRWSFAGDIRYIPVETSGSVRFANQSTEGEMHVRPLIVGFGVAYHF